jgi:erythromycin esterase
MWGNHEMVPLIRWLNNYNQQQGKEKIGFYGLDLYSFWEWTEDDLPVKDTVLRSAMQKLKDYFAPYNNDAMKYATAIHHGKTDGSAVTTNFWKNVRQFNGNKPPVNEAQFVLQEDAFLALDGERYFRVLTGDHVQALNLRDGHMAATINRLLKFHGPDAKAIIWVHNDHVSDANYSNAGNNGYTSMGEILRNEWGHNKIFSVGFGTYKGFVTAGYSWNASVQRQVVLPAKAGSWEALLHEENNENKLILSKDLQDNKSFNKWIEFRSIGASYSGAAIYNYSIMPRRFDVFLFIDSTTATKPLEIDSTRLK